LGLGATSPKKRKGVESHDVRERTRAVIVQSICKENSVNEREGF